jgi:type I restriction enzyme M protein
LRHHSTTVPDLTLRQLRDESLEDTENLPDPDILARDIAENLQSALEQFTSIQEDLEAE